MIMLTRALTETHVQHVMKDFLEHMLSFFTASDEFKERITVDTQRPGTSKG